MGFLWGGFQWFYYYTSKDTVFIRFKVQLYLACVVFGNCLIAMLRVYDAGFVLLNYSRSAKV